MTRSLQGGQQASGGRWGGLICPNPRSVTWQTLTGVVTLGAVASRTIPARRPSWSLSLHRAIHAIPYFFSIGLRAACGRRQLVPAGQPHTLEQVPGLICSTGHRSLANRTPAATWPAPVRSGPAVAMSMRPCRGAAQIAAPSGSR